MDLSDVPLLGVTASLAIENAIRDAAEKGVIIYLVGTSSKVLKRLERLGLFNWVSSNHLVANRKDALTQAVGYVKDKYPDLAAAAMNQLS
jgi:SulP family sulfate permease